MAVELGKFIKDQLEYLSPDHSDRRYLEDLLATTKCYIERARRGVAVFASVDQAVKEYQSKPHTSELVTQVYQTIWSERGKLVGATYKVDPCPYTQEELKELEQQEKRVGYFPPQLATQESLHLLGKMFPEMEIDRVEKDNPVTNEENPSSWFDYEAGADVPYFNTDEKQLTERVANDGRKLKLLNLNQYIIASQDSKLLTGQYLDYDHEWIQLGSCNEDYVVYANINEDGDGHLHVIWYLRSDNLYQGSGGRFSGVKKA